MIIEETHKKLHYGRSPITMAVVRQVCWIPTIRQRIRSILRRYVAYVPEQWGNSDLPLLPKSCVGSATPFAVTGVDFTGTLYVKERIGECKVYMCIFTCVSTRAIHLEIITDLVTQAFLLAFRRFSSRRSVILSDSSSTLLAATEELKTLLQSNDIKKSLVGKDADWRNKLTGMGVLEASNRFDKTSY